MFADTNVSTVMGTAQCTGIVMMLAERRGLPVALHTPTEVKAAVSGSGRADKRQVTAMVTHLLGLDQAPPSPRTPPTLLPSPSAMSGAAAPRAASPRPAEAHARTAPARYPPDPRPLEPPTMIASLSGTVLKAGLDSVVLGVGAWACSSTRRPRPRRPCGSARPRVLETSLVVREDSLTLYGFATEDEKRRLRDGPDRLRRRTPPRAGHARRARPESVRRALGAGDIAALTKVPGIGARGAERLVLELRDKLGALGGSADEPAAGGPADHGELAGAGA